MVEMIFICNNATSGLYPFFTFSGFLGFQGVADIFNAQKSAWSFGLPIKWNLFDGGRIRNKIKVEDARTQQALILYEQTVLKALEEVESSMAAYAQESVRSDALERSVVAAEKSVELVKTLYRTGLTDFQNVLDMERSLSFQQDELANSEGSVVKNLILVYKALGGGWVPEEPEPAAEDGSEKVEDKEE